MEEIQECFILFFKVKLDIDTFKYMDSCKI